MDHLVENWVTNKFDTPYSCTIKVAIVSGCGGEYDIFNFKSGVKARVDDILHFINKEIGDEATLFVIANTLLTYMSEAAYVEITMNGEDGITIYRNPTDSG